MAININDYLEQAGFGESALVHRNNHKAKSDGIPFDMNAYMEAYAEGMCLQYKIENEILKVQVEATKLQARGEGLDDIKDKVKSGVDKVKKFLIELYDKCIRFFTETVRYFFSAEKRYRKKMAKYKATLAKKITTSQDTKKQSVSLAFNVLLDFSRTYEHKNGGLYYTPDGGKKLRNINEVAIDRINKSDIPEKYKKKIIDSLNLEKGDPTSYITRSLLTMTERNEFLSGKERKAILDSSKNNWQDALISFASALIGDGTTDKGDVQDNMEELKNMVKELLLELKETMKAGAKTVEGTKAEIVLVAKAFLGSIVDVSDAQLQGGFGMKGMNSLIRKITEKKRKLAKTFKEDHKDSPASDKDTTLYKRDRAVLGGVMQMASALKSFNDYTFSLRIKEADKCVEIINGSLASNNPVSGTSNVGETEEL